METRLPYELQRLQDELDEFVLARGWPTEGYYFDDSSLDGFHLVKDEDGIWELSWQDARSYGRAERRFINLRDAFEEMKLGVIEMNQPWDESLTPSEAVEESTFEGVDPADLDDAEEEGDPVMLVMLLLFLLIPFLLVGLPLLLGIHTALSGLFR